MNGTWLIQKIALIISFLIIIALLFANFQIGCVLFETAQRTWRLIGGEYICLGFYIDYG